jgi:hypothetical protein
MFTPSCQRQEVTYLRDESVIQIYPNDSKEKIAQIRFDCDSSRVGGCGAVFSLSQMYKRPQEVAEIEKFVRQHFGDLGTLAMWDYTDPVTRQVSLAPFAIEVEYYNVRQVIAGLTQANCLPQDKTPLLNKWIDSLESYGKNAEKPILLIIWPEMFMSQYS